MKKIYEDKNILVEVDEITGAIYITAKKSDQRTNYILVNGHADGHLSIRANHSRFHPVLNGFNIWLNE